MTIVITLKSPVEHGKETIADLAFRDPTGEDITACGYPLMIGDGRAHPQAGIVSTYVSRLAGVPPSVVKKLSVADWQAAMQVVLGFFGTDAEETAT